MSFDVSWSPFIGHLKQKLNLKSEETETKLKKLTIDLQWHEPSALKQICTTNI